MQHLWSNSESLKNQEKDRKSQNIYNEKAIFTSIYFRQTDTLTAKIIE